MSSTYMTIWLNDAVKVRSLIPVVALVWRIWKSWFWKAPLAAGAAMSVMNATAALTTQAASTKGRKSRRGLTPEALKAATSMSAAMRPDTMRTATRRAMGRVRPRKAGSMKASRPMTRWNGTFLVMTRSVRS